MAESCGVIVDLPVFQTRISGMFMSWGIRIGGPGGSLSHPLREQVNLFLRQLPLGRHLSIVGVVLNHLHQPALVRIAGHDQMSKHVIAMVERYVALSLLARVALKATFNEYWTDVFLEMLNLLGRQIRRLE